MRIPVSPRRQAGLTLIEFSLALTAALVMAGFVSALYVSTQRSQSMDNLRNELLQVTAAASQLAASGQRDGISAAAIASSGLVPDSMPRVVSGNTVLGNSLGGEFQVEEADISGATAARALAVTVTGLDATRCQDLVMTTADRFDEVRVGGLAAGTTVKHGLNATPVVLDRTDVRDACEADPDASFLFVQ